MARVLEKMAHSTASDSMREQQIAFYRTWSSEAAEQATIADHPGAVIRCNHSAAIWTLIADLLEADEVAEVQRLTNNLLLLQNGSLVSQD